ncbi:hypothetical protein J6590_029903 [Homalodisca vitripennis]|nr:hypothetical protein J6590_029903 [Homalodisca vitripennis]
MEDMELPGLGIALLCLATACVAQGPSNQYLPPDKGYSYEPPSVPFPSGPSPSPSGPSPGYGPPPSSPVGPPAPTPAPPGPSAPYPPAGPPNNYGPSRLEQVYTANKHCSGALYVVCHASRSDNINLLIISERQTMKEQCRGATVERLAANNNSESLEGWKVGCSCV